MGPNKLLALLASVVVLWFVAGYILGPGTGTIVILAFIALVLSATKYFGWYPILPGTKKTALAIGVVSLAILLVMGGWLAALQSYMAPQATIGGTPRFGSTTPPVTTATTGCVVSDELRGKTVTVNLNAYDQESSTPASSAVDVSTVYVYKKVGNSWDLLGSTSDTTAYTGLSGITAGDEIKFSGGGASYYVDDKIVCMNSQSITVNLDAHAVCPEANMAITIFDSDGTELSDGTSTEDDYTMALGANEDKQIDVKLKVNVANKMFRVGGVATCEFNDVDDVYPVSSDFVIDHVYKDIKGDTVSADETNDDANFTCYDEFYKLKTPVELHQWESKTWSFVVEGGSTEPNGGGGSTSLDGFALLFVDSCPAIGDDFLTHDQPYAQTTAEANVCLDETETSPYGKQLGAIVECT